MHRIYASTAYNTRQMQSINGASLRVLNSLIERIALQTFYHLNRELRNNC